jgi:hypothetical protein
VQDGLLYNEAEKANAAFLLRWVAPDAPTTRDTLLRLSLPGGGEPAGLQAWGASLAAAGWPPGPQQLHPPSLPAPAWSQQAGGWAQLPSLADAGSEVPLQAQASLQQALPRQHQAQLPQPNAAEHSALLGLAAASRLHQAEQTQQVQQLQQPQALQQPEQPPMSPPPTALEAQHAQQEQQRQLDQERRRLDVQQLLSLWELLQQAVRAPLIPGLQNQLMAALRSPLAERLVAPLAAAVGAGTGSSDMSNAEEVGAAGDSFQLEHMAGLVEHNSPVAAEVRRFCCILHIVLCWF